MLVDEYISLVEICIEILNDNNYKINKLCVDKDIDLIYKTFLFNTNIDTIDKEGWIQLMKDTEIGHLSFLLNNTATLKSIFNEGTEIQKNKLLGSFINLSKKVKILERFSELKARATEKIQTKEEVEDIVLELLSDFQKYKKPEYLAKIIDTWSSNKEFRDYVIKQIKSKSTEIQKKIDETGIFTDEDKSNITENIDDFNVDGLINNNDYINFFKNVSDYIMKLNINGEIKVSRDLHLYVSNYVILLFKESFILSKVLNLIDEEYKMYECEIDKSKYILRYNTSKIKQIKVSKKKDVIDKGFGGLIESDKKVVYNINELRKRIVHTILKIVEIMQHSFLGNNFEDFDKEKEIKNVFKTVDDITLDEISFTNILDIIVGNEIDDIIDRNKLRELVINVFERIVMKEKNENLLKSIISKLDEFLDFFKNKKLEEKAINIAKRICSFLDSNVNWSNIKKAIANKKKISFKTYSN